MATEKQEERKQKGGGRQSLTGLLLGFWHPAEVLSMMPKS